MYSMDQIVTNLLADVFRCLEGTGCSPRRKVWKSSRTNESRKWCTVLCRLQIMGCWDHHNGKYWFAYKKVQSQNWGKPQKHYWMMPYKILQRQASLLISLHTAWFCKVSLADAQSLLSLSQHGRLTVKKHVCTFFGGWGLCRFLKAEYILWSWMNHCNSIPNIIVTLINHTDSA